MNRTSSTGETKYIPILRDNNEDQKEDDASSAYLLPPPSENLGKFSSGDGGINIHHPAIQAYKQVTGYYPSKRLYQRIVDLLGNAPPIGEMQKAFDSWIANGYNPKNIKGWLFDWFKEKMYYVPPQQKFED